MSRIQGFVPIHKAEEALARKQATDKLEMAKKEIIQMLHGDLKDFDMSCRRVFTDSNIYLESWGHESVEDKIMKAQNTDQLNYLKDKIAFSALGQLGATYSVKKNGGWGEYDGLCYDSPTLRRREVGLKDNFGFSIFDPDVALKDIPLLIKKAKELTEKVKEEGIIK
ncbi:MAG: hypothetical protein HY094_09380 [Candidatus Melainabacteria bacterium]|nr:hypothetical protein [Candidatus Melainabacteria bacterium]